MFKEKEILLPPDVAEIKISYSTNVKPNLRPKITSAQDAYQILLTTWDQSKIQFVEQFKVLLLNRANKVLGVCEISSGGTAGTVVDAKLIFATALKANAHSIILCHNHPSGEVKPSEADIQLTGKIQHAGTFLDLPIIDHLIISPESFFSFSDEGKM